MARQDHPAPESDTQERADKHVKEEPAPSLDREGCGRCSMGAGSKCNIGASEFSR